MAQDTMHGHWMLQGRLSPPSFRIGLLERPALARLTAEGLAYKATILTAPPGYGKTALLSQWREALNRRNVVTAWTNLTLADADPAQVLTCLTMSLLRAGVDLGPLEHLAEQWFADTPIPAAVGTLATHLARDGRPLVLMIDDVQYASRAVAEQVLLKLTRPGLNNVHLALAGRARPPLPLADMRSRGELLELDAEALRFDETALAMLLPTLTPEQRRLLASRTEGWPVALQLAKLWLDARPDRVSLIEGFSGRTTEVADYLTEQVLADLPPEIATTLELTAPLDALCAEVATAVTGSASAWPAVVAAPALAHLVVPLDESRTWYRLHPLLSDYLRHRLRSTAPEIEARSHARASAWFESHQMTLEAVHHAAAAGDLGRAAALIERTGGWELVLFGGATLMRALLAEIPVERLPEFPRVELYRTLLDAKAGALPDARRRFDEAARLIQARGTVPSVATPVGRDLQVIRQLLLRYEDRPIAPDALHSIYRDIEVLDPGDAVARATFLNTACLLGLGLGEMQAAQDACDRAVREMRKLDSILGVNYCSVHLGLAWLHLGKRREAEAIFFEAAELAEENFGADSGLRAVADVHLAAALVTRGAYPEASVLFDRSLAQVEAYDGWLDMYAEGYRAAIATALAAGAVPRAEEYVARGLVTASKRGLVRLERLMRAARIRIDVREGRLEAARAALAWDPDAWASVPYHWREYHAFGLAAAELLLADGDAAAARAVLHGPAAAARDGHRVRDARAISFIDALARFALGEREEATATVVATLEAALLEEDTEFLVESGELAAPLLQYVRQWTRDHATGSLARKAIGRALAQLAAAGARTPLAGVVVLSTRELEVLGELEQGSSNKVIARALQMTENTVKFHLKNIFQKLDVRHRTQAIRAAREQGLIR